MASVHKYEVKPDPKIKGDKGIRYLVAYNKDDGKPTSKRGFLRKAEANAYANKVEEDKRKGVYVSPALGRITVGELATKWLKVKKANLKKSSYTAVEGAWRLHVKARWESVKVSDITTEAVEAWLVELKLDAKKRAEIAKERGGKISDGSSLIRQAHTALVGILDLAVKGKRLPKNPARGAEGVPKIAKRRHVYLTAADVARLADESGDRRTLVLTLAYCGIRWGEATALRVRDIDFTRGRFTIHENAVQLSDGIEVGTTKSNRIRQVPVPRFVLDEIKERVKRRNGDALVFPHPGDPDEYQTRPGMEGWFLGAVKRAKVQRVTPHDLRHTCASLAVSAGANVIALSRMLGHKDASTTLDTYADLFDEDLDRVAAKMDGRYSGTVTVLVPRTANPEQDERAA